MSNIHHKTWETLTTLPAPFINNVQEHHLEKLSPYICAQLILFTEQNLNAHYDGTLPSLINGLKVNPQLIEQLWQVKGNEIMKKDGLELLEFFHKHKLYFYYAGGKEEIHDNVLTNPGIVMGLWGARLNVLLSHTLEQLRNLDDAPTMTPGPSPESAPQENTVNIHDEANPLDRGSDSPMVNETLSAPTVAHNETPADTPVNAPEQSYPPVSFPPREERKQTEPKRFGDIYEEYKNKQQQQQTPPPPPTPQHAPTYDTPPTPEGYNYTVQPELMQLANELYQKNSDYTTTEQWQNIIEDRKYYSHKTPKGTSKFLESDTCRCVVCGENITPEVFTANKGLCGETTPMHEQAKAEYSELGNIGYPAYLTYTGYPMRGRLSKKG